MSTPDSDTLQRFHFETAAVRGELVRLGASLREILGQHFYPAPVAVLLGETLAASALLSSTLKYSCLLYTSDAADERSSVDLGGRRIIKKININKRTFQRLAPEHIFIDRETRISRSELRSCEDRGS